MKELLRKYIRKIINESFDYDLNKTFSELTEEDLFEIARWGLTNDFNFSACWDEANDNLEVAAKCAVEDFKNILSDSFPEGLKGFPTVATLYRFVTLENPESLNRANLGGSWFANPKTINDPDFKEQLLHLSRTREPNHGLYLIIAKIPIEKINIVRTLWQRSLIYVENEVVLKDDTNIDIVDLKLVQAPRKS